MFGKLLSIHMITHVCMNLSTVFLSANARLIILTKLWKLQDLLTYGGLQRFASVFGVVAPEGATRTEVKAAEEAIRFPSFA